MKASKIEKAMEPTQLKLDILETKFGIKGGKVAPSGVQPYLYNLLFDGEVVVEAMKLKHIDLYIAGMFKVTGPPPAAEPAPAKPEKEADAAPPPVRKRAVKKDAPAPAPKPRTTRRGVPAPASMI